MKISQGDQGLANAQLIEQMQQAHAEAKQTKAPGGFDLQSPSSVGAPAEQAPSSLERSVMDVAQGVLSGSVKRPESARRQVIEAIVDDRFSTMVSPRDRARTIDTLETTLAQDPAFAREVDAMLILAAQRLAT